MLTLRVIRLLLMAVIAIPLCPMAAPASPEPPAPMVIPPSVQSIPPRPQVNGRSAVLMDLDTGWVIYSKDAHAHLPNASTTKIMTAILLIEHCKMADRIKASKNAAETPYTSLHLKAGETITVQDLLTGMLIRSANDAAVAAAEHIAKNTDRFADMMNRKARKIGCTDTHFVTPNGLYDPDHYSSAYDLCLMARYAMRYPIFNEAICMRKYYLNSRSMNKEDLCVFAHSRFLRDYPGADGVKSGYTKQSKKCYVGSATRDGWRLVSAVLGSSDANHDTALMMNYAFENYRPVTVLKAGDKCSDADVRGGWSGTVPAIAARELKVPVPKTGGTITTRVDFDEIKAPIEKGAKIGRLRAFLDDKKVAEMELLAGDNVDISFARRIWTLTKGCGIIVACLIGGIYARKTAKSSRRRRRRVSSSMRGYDRWR